MEETQNAAAMLETTVVLQRIGLAVALGLLVGMQRERAASSLAGIRTFPLITAWGTLTALLALRFGGWIVAAGALALAALMVVENRARRAEPRPSKGITTEMAACVMFAAGAYLVVGDPTVSIAISGGLAFLLHQKGPLHRMVARIGEDDFRAVMQLALLSLVILPVLPDRPFGPYDSLNPFRTWLMVVLVSGLGFAGYVAFRLFGSSAGAFLGGILGGLVSSTATTVSYARRTRGGTFAQLVITLASTVAFGRILVEIAAVSPRMLPEVGPPLAIVLAAMVLVSLALYLFVRKEKVELPEAENPAALGPALAFGAIYALVTLASALAERWLGASGLYAIAIVSGLTDVDAITLSTASLAGRDVIPAALAWRVILAAALANLAFKFAIVCVLGPRLAPRIGLSFGTAFAVGLALIALWPR